MSVPATVLIVAILLPIIVILSHLRQSLALHLWAENQGGREPRGPETRGAETRGGGDQGGAETRGAGDQGGWRPGGWRPGGAETRGARDQGGQGEERLAVLVKSNVTQ